MLPGHSSLADAAAALAAALAAAALAAAALASRARVTALPAAHPAVCADAEAT